MKRKVAIIMAFICVVTYLAACSYEEIVENIRDKTEAEAEDDKEPVDVTLKDKYAIVTQDADDPYGKLIIRSFEAVCRETDNECVVREPEKGLASEQISIVEELMQMKVSAIAISPVDPKALRSVLKKAIGAGIHVCSYDTPARPTAREIHVSGSDTQSIAVTLMDAVLDLSGGEGEWAVLSTRQTAYNRNQWIKAMKELAKEDEKYSGIAHAETAYCEEDYRKAYDQTNSILKMKPDVKVIVAMSTIAMKGAAQAVMDMESDVLVTGIGFPSGLEQYIGSDRACPYMFMWSPTLLGKVTAYVTIGLGTGKIKGEIDEQFRIGSEEIYQVTEAADEAAEVIVDYPHRYDSGNIADLADDV
jgi:rhamnose transport system substrate-binding protein